MPTTDLIAKVRTLEGLSEEDRTTLTRAVVMLDVLEQLAEVIDLLTGATFMQAPSRLSGPQAQARPKYRTRRD